MTFTPAPTPQGCALDIDCPNATICFLASRTSWVKEKYGAAGSFCECPRGKGFSGYPHCTTIEPAYHAELVFHIFLLIILIVSLMVTIYDCVRLKRIKQMAWHRPTAQTSVFVFMATITHIVGVIFTRLCSFPDNHRIVAAGLKLCPYTNVNFVFTALGTLFSFLSQGNVAVVWLQLVNSIENFSKQSTNNARWAMYFLEIAYFGVLIYAVGKLLLTIALMTTVVYCLILIVAYVYGGCSLASILKTSLRLTHDPLTATPSGGQERMQMNSVETSLRRVQYVTFVMSFLFIAQICSLVTGAILTIRSGGIAYEEDYWFRPLATILHVNLFLMVIMNVIVIIYIHSSISTAVITFLNNNRRPAADEEAMNPKIEPNQLLVPLPTATISEKSDQPPSVAIADD